MSEWMGKAIEVGGEVLKGAAAGSAVMPGVGTIIGAVALPAAKLAGQLLPGIAQEFARPEVASAAAVVVQSMTGKPDTTIGELNDDQISDLRVQLAQIAQQAEEVRQNAFIDSIKTAAADRSDARKMTVDLATEHSSIAWGAPIVTAMVLIMTAAFYALILYKGLSGDTAVRIEATLEALSTVVVYYWVGSNSDSRRKTGIIASQQAALQKE